MRDITLEDTLYVDFTTRAFATGIPTVLAGSPVLSVLEENNATPITAGVSVSVDRASVVGLNMATIVATAANGYENGKGYSIYISTGTVGGVSAVGEVVGQFTIGASAAAVDLANGTDGLGAIKTDTAAVLVDTGTTIPATITTAQNDLDTITGSDGVTIASGTQTFNMTGNVTGNLSGSVGSVTGAVGSVTGAVGSVGSGGIAAATFAANAIDAAALATDAVAEIADQVWDEAIAGHAGVGSTGEALAAASSAGDPWATAVPGAYGAGTAGSIIGSLPDVTAGAAGGVFIAGTNAATTITTSLTTTFTGNLSGSVGSVTGATGSVTGAVGSVAGNVDGNVTGSVGSLVGHTVQTADHTTNIASILTDTGTTIPATITTAQADLDTITGTGGVIIGTDTMTEAYAADGAAASLPQLQYMIWSALSEFAIAGTTVTAKKLDGSTTAMTFTLDDGTDPTSRTRAT